MFPYIIDILSLDKGGCRSLVNYEQWLILKNENIAVVDVITGSKDVENNNKILNDYYSGKGLQKVIKTVAITTINDLKAAYKDSDKYQLIGATGLYKHIKTKYKCSYKDLSDRQISELMDWIK